MADELVQVIKITDVLNTSQDNSCQWCELGVCEHCEDNSDGGATRRYNNKVADEPAPDVEPVSEFG